MSFLVPIISGLLSRIDGVGVGDGFLPIYPFSLWRYGGVNYTRYAIGLFVWAVTLNPVYISSYFCAAVVPWGEKHWWMRGGLLSWFLIGCLWGGASLIPLYALFMGVVVVIAKIYDLDHAWFEFMIGSLSTLWVVFK